MLMQMCLLLVGNFSGKYDVVEQQRRYMTYGDTESFEDYAGVYLA